MSLLTMSVKHGRSLDEARTRLESVVAQVQSQFGAVVQNVTWGADRNSVSLLATGIRVDLRVDVEAVHVSADVPALSQFLSRPLMAGLKSVIEDKFQRRLTGP